MAGQVSVCDSLCLSVTGLQHRVSAAKSRECLRFSPTERLHKLSDSSAHGQRPFIEVTVEVKLLLLLNKPIPERPIPTRAHTLAINYGTRTACRVIMSAPLRQRFGGPDGLRKLWRSVQSRIQSSKSYGTKGHASVNPVTSRLPQRQLISDQRERREE